MFCYYKCYDSKIIVVQCNLCSNKAWLQPLAEAKLRQLQPEVLACHPLKGDAREFDLPKGKAVSLFYLTSCLNNMKMCHAGNRQVENYPGNLKIHWGKPSEKSGNVAVINCWKLCIGSPQSTFCNQ